MLYLLLVLANNAVTFEAVKTDHPQPIFPGAKWMKYAILKGFQLN